MKNKNLLFSIIFSLLLMLVTVFGLQACGITKQENPMLVVEVQDNSKQKVVYDKDKEVEFTFLAAQDAEGDVTYELLSAKDEDGKNVDYFSLQPNKATSIKVKKGIPAGTYTLDIKAKTEGNDKYKEAEKNITYLFTVNKAKCELEKPKAIENLIYNGKSQQLVEPGKCETGKHEYKLNEDGEWSEEVPEATEAGVYTVFYRVTGDENHEDIKEDFLLVSIDRQNVSYRPRSYSYASGSSLSLTSLFSNIKNSTHFTRHVTRVPIKPSEYVEYLYDGQTHYNGFNAPSGVNMIGVDSGTNAGKYIAYYTPDFNHEWPDGSRDTIKVVMDIKKANPTIDIKTRTLTYNALPQKLIDSATVSGGSVVYSLDKNIYTPSIPSARDAGTYTVYYRVLGDLNHNNLDGEVSVTINKKTLTTPSITDSYTYNGLPHAVKVNDFNILYMAYDKQSQLIETDAGEYNVIIKLNSPKNYQWSDKTSSDLNLTWTIEKADAVIKKHPKPKILIYTSKEQSLVTAGSSTTGTMMYSLSKDGEYSTEIPKATDAGKYTIYYYCKGDENHNDSPVYTVETTIAKVIPFITTYPSGRDIEYDGQDHELIANGESKHGHFEYSVDGQEFSKDIPVESQIGTYTYKWRFVGDKNHLDVDGFFTITSRIAVTKTAEFIEHPSAIQGLTYNGEYQELITPGTCEGGTLEYLIVGQTEVFSSEIPVAKEVGTYDVAYRIRGDEYHLNTPTYYLNNITISKGVLEVYSEDQVYEYDGEYHGDPVTVNVEEDVLIEYRTSTKYSEEVPMFADVKFDILGRVQSRTIHYRVSSDNYETVTGSYTITINKKPYDLVYLEDDSLVYNDEIQGPEIINYDANAMTIKGTDTAINVGKHIIYVSLKDTHNTEWTNGHTNVIILPWQIEKASVELVNPEAIEGLRYTGYPQDLITAGQVKGGTLQYSLDGSPYSEGIPQALNEGFYTVTYRVVADKNHIDRAPVEIQVIIDPALIKVNAPDQSFVYNGEYQGNEITDVETVNEMPYEIVYSDDPNYYDGTYEPIRKDAGSSTIYYLVSANRHEIYLGQYVLTIEKAPGEVNVHPTLKDNIVYDGQVHNLIASLGQSNTGVMMYSLNGVDYYETLPDVVDAGEYTVHYYAKGDDNHKDSDIYTLTTSIAKLAVDVPNVTNTVFDYNSQTQGPSINGFDETLMYIQGNTQAIDAGTYEFTIGLKDKVNYMWSNGSQDMSFSFVINKVASQITQEPVAKQLTYNATSQALVEMGSANGGTIVYSLDGINFANEVYGVNAGEYLVYYKVLADNNHNDSEVYTLTSIIDKAQLQIIQNPSAIDGLVFNGQANTLINPGITAVDNGAYSPFKYSVNGSEFSYNLPSGLEAGSYQIEYKLDNVDNFYFDESFEPIYVTIQRAENDIYLMPSSYTTSVYNGQANYIDVANFVVNPKGYLTYRISSVNGADSQLFKMNESVLTIPENTPVGTYAINILVNDTGNLSYYEKQLSLEVYINVVENKAQDLTNFNIQPEQQNQASHDTQYVQTPLVSLQDEIIRIYNNYEQFIDGDGKISFFKVGE